MLIDIRLDIQLDSTSIHQLYDLATTRLRLQSFGIRLENEPRVGTPIFWSLLTRNSLLFVQASLEESIALQESHLREGNVYLPVASFASDLYFTISDLTKLNNLYRISLSAFIRLFQKSLEKAPHGGTSSDKVR